MLIFSQRTTTIRCPEGDGGRGRKSHINRLQISYTTAQIRIVKSCSYCLKIGSVAICASCRVSGGEGRGGTSHVHVQVIVFHCPV